MLAINKTILGTVQFGLDYGINNSLGKPKPETVFSILDLAHENNIKLLDSAEAYGNSYEIIGQYHARANNKFEVITKFCAARTDLPSWIVERVEHNLKTLSVDSIYCYMFHSFSDFVKYYPRYKQDLIALKESGKVGKIGVSVYTNSEIEKLLEEEEIDVLQLPFNLLDNVSQRLSVLEKAKLSGKEIHARSIFLQGLFFKNTNELPRVLQPLRPHLEEIQKLAIDAKINLNQLCLKYAFEQEGLDHVLIGVDSLEQLVDNIRAISEEMPDNIFKKINEITVAETELLSPRNWNNNVIAITQARMGSTRLPNKSMKEIEGKSLLEIHINRILKSKKINQLIVATTSNPEDQVIESLCNAMDIEVFRGSEKNVLDRFYQAVKEKKPTHIVRLTADCPLIDPKLIDDVIKYAIENDLDYCANTLIEDFPDGEDIEVMKFSTLEKAWKTATQNYEKEHVTPFIRENSSFVGGKLFSSDNFSAPGKYGAVRLTVDEIQDFEVISLLIKKLGIDRTWQEYANMYLNDSAIFAHNSKIKRNEGFKKD